MRRAVCVLKYDLAQAGHKMAAGMGKIAVCVCLTLLCVLEASGIFKSGEGQTGPKVTCF